jgi:hypothetical protein
MYIVSVSCGCCKSRYRWCIYCNAIHVCFKCSMFQMFYFFRHMLQVFYLGVAKVDLDVGFVAMATHVCYKCMFRMFDLFQTYLCNCVHLGVAKVDLDIAYVAMTIL